VSLVAPACFYTVGMSLAVEFFDTHLPFIHSYNLQFGYAAKCALAGTVLIWLCVLFYLISYSTRYLSSYFRDRKHESFNFTSTEQLQGDGVQMVTNDAANTIENAV
jgi:hypothetical protein